MDFPAHFWCEKFQYEWTKQNSSEYPSCYCFQSSLALMSKTIDAGPCPLPAAAISLSSREKLECKNTAASKQFTRLVSLAPALG